MHVHVCVIFNLRYLLFERFERPCIYKERLRYKPKFALLWCSLASFHFSLTSRLPREGTRAQKKPHTTKSWEAEPDKWPCLNSCGPADWRRRFLGCGGGGNLLMGIGKSQIAATSKQNLHPQSPPANPTSASCALCGLAPCAISISRSDSRASSAPSIQTSFTRKENSKMARNDPK